MKTKCSISAIAKEWLDSKESQLKQSSISKYSNIIRWYLIPQFGEMNVFELTRYDVMLFSRRLVLQGGVANKPLSPKTVNGIVSVLKSIINFASYEKGIKVTDLREITIKQPQKNMRILSINEQKTLNQYLLKNINPCYLGILLCLYTGIRIGEVCALKWENICIDEKYLNICQSMQRIQIGINTETKKKTKIIIQPPKSECSVRRIPIPSDLFDLINSFKCGNDAFLLTGTSEKYIEPRCLENRFKKVAAKCSITRINYHALRHTFATRCVELGFDIKSLSEILGHASVNITLNRYVHPSMELKQKNMNRLTEAFEIKEITTEFVS